MPGIPNPEGLSGEDKALIAAMELLRRQFATSAAQVAVNTQRSAEDYARQAVAMREFLAGLGGRVSPTVIPGTTVSGAATTAAPRPRTGQERGETGGSGIKTADPGAMIPGSNAPPRGPTPGAPLTPGGVPSNPVLGVLSRVAGAFGSIIGPMAAFGKVIDNSLSGFQALNQAVKVVATTLAPVLQPATVLLSAGLLAVAGVLESRLMPVMEKWSSSILETSIPVLELLVDSFALAADDATDFADAVSDTINRIKRRADRPDLFSNDRTNIRDAVASRGTGKDSGDRGLSNTLQILRQSMGPDAQIGSLGSAARDPRLAPMNAGPLDARMLKTQQDMLAKLGEVAENTRRNVGGPGFVHAQRGGKLSCDPGSGGSVEGGF